MSNLLVALGVALFVAAMGCYGMRPEAHMAPIGDLLLTAAVGCGLAVLVRKFTDNHAMRMLAYGAIWLAIAFCPIVIGYVRHDGSGLMGMLTLLGLLPAAIFLIKGAVASIRS